MTDWASEISKQPAGQPQQAPQQSGTDWAAQVTGMPERPTVTPVYDENRGATAGQIAVGSMASDKGEQIRYFASKLYPNEPLELSAKRFDIGSDSEIYHVADDGKAYSVHPDGFDMSNPMRSLASGVGPSIPGVAGALTGVATAPLMMTGAGTALSLAATGAAGYAGDIARQKLGDALMGSDVTDGQINQYPAIKSAAFEGLGQGIGKGFGALSERYAVSDIGKYNPQSTKDASDRASRLGVSLTPAETTGLSSLAAEQKRLGNLPQTQDIVQEFYQKRNDQVYSAWEGFLNGISKNGDIDDVTAMAQKAAQGAIKQAEDARAAAASPIYQRVVQPENLVEGFQPDDLLQSVIKGLRRDPVYKGVVKDLPDNSMVVLDRAYKRLGDMISGAQKGGQNDRARVIKNIQRDLADQIDQSFPEYSAARQAFAEGSGPLDDLLGSTVKILAGVTDNKTKMAIVDVLNPAKRTPASVARLRFNIEGQDPETWQAIKRVFLQSEMTNAWRVDQRGEIINPAGKLYQRFAQRDMRAVMKAAMSPDEWTSFTDLLTVMRDASTVKPIGSDTEWNRLMTQAAEDRAKGVIGKLVEVDVTKPFKLVNDFLVQRRVDKNAMRMAELIVSGDKDVIKKLRELRMLKPTDWRWRAAFGQLLGLSAQGAVPANAADNSIPSNEAQSD